MKICEAILADLTPTPSAASPTGEGRLPPIGEAMYQYVVARNGLFIRAEDSRMRALVQIAPAASRLHGLAELEPFAELKVDRVPGVWLRSVLASARRRIPDEAMYQFLWDGSRSDLKPEVFRTWRCSSPAQVVTPTGVRFEDDGQAVIDLHSHNSMAAFFSETDDADEQGLRFYAVIGHVDTDTPEIRVRVGVYGHFMDVPADMVFDDLGPFVDQLSVDSSQSSEDGDGPNDLILGRHAIQLRTVGSYDTDPFVEQDR